MDTEKVLKELKETIEDYKNIGFFGVGVKDLEKGKQVALEWVLAEIDKKIEAIPSVEVKDKIGYWVRWYEVKEYSWGSEHIPHCKCSECGREYNPHTSQFIKYCPNCGTRLVEQKTEDIREQAKESFFKLTGVSFDEMPKLI